MGRYTSVMHESKISFVIPIAGKMRQSRIGKNDKALCFSLDRGYIESRSYDACVITSRFLDLTLKSNFILIGKVDKVLLKSGEVVYRQRVYFTSIATLVKISANFGIDIIITDSFKVGISQISRCVDWVSDLEMYSKNLLSDGLSLDMWLTYCCIVQLYILCEEESVRLVLPKPIESYLVDGLLVRAPYICGSFSQDGRGSTVVIPPEEAYIVKGVDLLSCATSKVLAKRCRGYIKIWHNIRIPIYGLTTKNIAIDKRYGG